MNTTLSLAVTALLVAGRPAVAVVVPGGIGAGEPFINGISAQAIAVPD